VGIGGFYYNPKGLNSQAAWVALKPLHTEGQGLDGGPKQYSNFSLSIPMGGYYKLTINKIWSVGVEFSYRKTLTDYIDDVSGTYYDPTKLEAAYGPMSAQMSDPSKGRLDPNSPFYSATSPGGYGQAAQRGDRQKDAYMSLEISVSYIFKKQRRSARLRSKF
jgi:hypothetical protein